MKLKILSYPNPILRNKNRKIQNNSESLQILIDDMFDTIKYNGVGLAAPQIGENIMLFVINYGIFRGKKVFINPSIEIIGDKTTYDYEGCLSLPGKIYNIQRYDKIKITYLDRNFKKNVDIYNGTYSRIIQHEYDHLIGKTINML